MSNPLLMSGTHRIGQRNGDLEELVERQALLRKQLRKRLPSNQLHGDEVDTIRLLDRVHMDNVGMVERRYRLGLPLETHPAFLGSHFRRQNLQRHFATELRILGDIDVPHPAGAKLFEDFVMA